MEWHVSHQLKLCPPQPMFLPLQQSPHNLTILLFHHTQLFQQYSLLHSQLQISLHIQLQICLHSILQIILSVTLVHGMAQHVSVVQLALIALQDQAGIIIIATPTKEVCLAIKDIFGMDTIAILLTMFNAHQILNGMDILVCQIKYTALLEPH